jgi:uncharacterized protein (DUF2147 family)
MFKKALQLLLLSLAPHLFAADIVGFWKSIDEDSGLARCCVAVYEYEGLCYGRIIGTYDTQGKMKDSIYKPVERAPGVVGDPYYSGLDLIWNLEDNGSSFDGKILDPEKGNVYRAELWKEGNDLIVRGKLFFFHRSQTWLPAEKSDFPTGFKMPDTSTFVPVIPQVK